MRDPQQIPVSSICWPEYLYQDLLPTPRYTYLYRHLPTGHLTYGSPFETAFRIQNELFQTLYKINIYPKVKP